MQLNWQAVAGDVSFRRTCCVCIRSVQFWLGISAEETEVIVLRTGRQAKACRFFQTLARPLLCNLLASLKKKAIQWEGQGIWRELSFGNPSQRQGEGNRIVGRQRIREGT